MKAHFIAGRLFYLALLSLWLFTLGDIDSSSDAKIILITPIVIELLFIVLYRLFVGSSGLFHSNVYMELALVIAVVLVFSFGSLFLLTVEDLSALEIKAGAGALIYTSFHIYSGITRRDSKYDKVGYTIIPILIGVAGAQISLAFNNWFGTSLNALISLYLVRELVDLIFDLSLHEGKK